MSKPPAGKGMELKFRKADFEFRTEIREFIDAPCPAQARAPRGIASHYPAEHQTFEQAWLNALANRGRSCEIQKNITAISVLGL